MRNGLPLARAAWRWRCPAGGRGGPLRVGPSLAVFTPLFRCVVDVEIQVQYLLEVRPRRLILGRCEVVGPRARRSRRRGRRSYTYTSSYTRYIQCRQLPRLCVVGSSLSRLSYSSMCRQLPRVGASTIQV
jgi:hypothetical protein